MGLFNLFKKKKAEEKAPEVKEKPKTQTQQKVSAQQKKPNPQEKTKEAPEPKETKKSLEAAAQKEKEISAEKEKAPSFAGKFEIKKSKDDRFVFNLYAANSVIVATSQVYSSSTGAQNGIKSVIENAPKAAIEDQTLKSYEALPYPKWEIYLDKGNQYRFRLNASNGSCICHSQGYTTKSSCKKGIESIIKTAKNAKIDKLYLRKD